MGMWQATMHTSVFPMASVMAFLICTVFLSSNQGKESIVNKNKIRCFGLG